RASCATHLSRHASRAWGCQWFPVRRRSVTLTRAIQHTHLCTVGRTVNVLPAWSRLSRMILWFGCSLLLTSQPLGGSHAFSIDYRSHAYRLFSDSCPGQRASTDAARRFASHGLDDCGDGPGSLRS